MVKAAVARELALSPGALAWIDTVYLVAYAAGHSFDEAVAFESEMMALTGATRDHREAAHAFVNKQRPTFEGR